METSDPNKVNGLNEKEGTHRSPAPHRKFASGLLWTRRQRLTLAVLLLPIAGWLMYLAIDHPMQIADPLIVVGPRSGELATRIDPNVADWPVLAALPVLGEKMARTIVAYREAHHAAGEGGPAFGEINDLMRVKGIGKATTRALEPLLVFPGRPELIRDLK